MEQPPIKPPEDDDSEVRGDSHTKGYRIPYEIRVSDIEGDGALNGQDLTTAAACSTALRKSAQRTGWAGPGSCAN